VVLSHAEVRALFQPVRNLKHRALLMTVSAAGLRVGEVVKLRVTDIDSQRMGLRIEQGKGRKDRYGMRSPTRLGTLREYWKLARPQAWLFPGQPPPPPCAARAPHASSTRPGRRPASRSGCPATHCGPVSPPPGLSAGPPSG
jgi:integrase